jgi:hypothetical protein
MSDSPLIFNPYANDFVSFVRDAIKKAIYEIHTCIPAIVKEVKGRDKVVVSPAVQQTGNEWQSVPWADMTLPVCTPQGNGLFVSFPLAVGDTGWIIAGDLDPSLFFKNPDKPQRQNTFDRHEYRFGFFIPNMVSGYTVDSEDDGSLVIGSKDGNTKVVIGNDSLKIKSDSVIIETTDNASVTIDGVDWKTHNHDVTANVGEVTVNTNTGKNVSPLTWTSGGVNQ